LGKCTAWDGVRVGLIRCPHSCTSCYWSQSIFVSLLYHTNAGVLKHRTHNDTDHDSRQFITPSRFLLCLLHHFDSRRPVLIRSRLHITGFKTVCSHHQFYSHVRRDAFATLLSRPTDTIRTRSPSPFETPVTSPAIPTTRLVAATPSPANPSIAPWSESQPPLALAPPTEICQRLVGLSFAIYLCLAH
jgi:hypothetical protein